MLEQDKMHAAAAIATHHRTYCETFWVRAANEGKLSVESEDEKTIPAPARWRPGACPATAVVPAAVSVPIIPAAAIPASVPAAAGVYSIRRC